MAWTLEFAGRKNTSIAWASADIVTITAVEFKPSLFLIQETITGSSGTFDSAQSFRLNFLITPEVFYVDPVGGTQNNNKYFELMKVLRNKYIRITAIGSNFKRSVGTNSLTANAYLSALPIECRLLSIAELDSDFATGTNSVNFELSSIGRYSF